MNVIIVIDHRKSNLASVRLEFWESNFFSWIRSAPAMEAYFPRKALAMHGGLFAPGGVACSTKSLASFPGPAQLSVACSTVKRRKVGWGLGTRLRSV